MLTREAFREALGDDHNDIPSHDFFPRRKEHDSDDVGVWRRAIRSGQ